MLIRNRSISFRLTTWFLSIFILGWILFGLAMWLDLNSALTTTRQQTLDHRADRLTQLLRDTQDLPQERQRKKFQEFAGATGDGLMEVFDAAGARFFPSPSSAAASFPWPRLQEGPQRFWQSSVGEQKFLVLTRPIELGGRTLHLCFAASLTNNRALLRRFTVGLFAAAPILLALSAIGGYFVSRKALVPVDRITASVQTISVSNLSGRLAVAQTGDELQRLAETFNAMLTRLEDAVGRIRQFTGDASHELRGPLSYIKMVAEVALRRDGMDDESRIAFQEVVAETRKAGVLLEDMLTLARADCGEPGFELLPVELSRCLRQVCDKADPLARERSQTLTVAIHGAAAEILGDESSLARLFWILLDNALKYTPEGGAIEVNLSATAEAVTVTVKDSGLGIAPADLPHIFDRFYRADPSRSQVDGTGLGLAIAKWIANVHHAALSAQSKLGQGSSFSIVFPRVNETP